MKLTLILLGLKLGSLAALALASSPLTLAAEYWGGEQPLTLDQMVTAEHLAFPQSYEAMRFLGVPKWRNRISDWYPLPRGGYLRVDYERGQAVAISWEES